MLESGDLIEFSYVDGTAKGYFVSPVAETSANPAVIVIHEWWGLNEHIQSIANRFSKEGYVVLAPDLYGGLSTKDPAEAGELMQALDQNEGINILKGAVEYLTSTDIVDEKRIGVTGFCMGGTFALLLACKDANITASAPFYGDIPSENILEDLSVPLLFIGAENDFWITQEKMTRLSDALNKFEKPGEVNIYSGVGHAFFNDTRSDAYDAVAAKDAWKVVNEFFASYLR